MFVFLSVGAFAQTNRFPSDKWSILEDEKCDGSIDIEIIRHKGGHTWGHKKTIYLQYKNSSGNWIDLAYIVHDYTDHNTYRASSANSAHYVRFENRNPGMGYSYYAYKLKVSNAPNPNNRVAYRWIQKDDGEYLSDTKYAKAYKPQAVTLTAHNANACGRVEITWEKPSNVDGNVEYKISRKRKGQSYWNYKGQQTARTYNDTSVGDNIYEYKVQAYLSCGNTGLESIPVEGHGILPIVAPKNFEANGICNNKVRLTWQKPAITPRSYQIKYANNTAFNSASEVNVDNGNIVQKDVELSAPFVNYYFKVRTKNECDSYGPWSETRDAMGFNLPDAPENFTSELIKEENAFLFRWEDVSNEEKYIIRRTNIENGTEVVDFEVDENVTSFKDETINFCNSYRYTLYSYRTCGEVRGESLSLTLTPDLSNYFTNFDISKGYYSNRVELRWDVPSDRRISEVRIFRSRKGELNKELVASLESRQRSWTDNKAASNVLYEYKLVGIQFCGQTSVETNAIEEVGFRMPFGTVYGNIAFEGGNPVPDAEVIAEPIDNNGLIGYSTEFTGNSYIDISHIEAFNSLSQITAQMFLKADASSASSDQIVASCFDESTKKGFQLLYNASANQLKAKVGNGSSVIELVGDATLSSSSFEYVALSISESEIKIFLNENEIATKSISASIQIPDSNLRVGGVSNTGGFKGLIDEFAFYSIAKSSKQLAIDYNRKLSAEENNLLVYLQMDEGVGEYAYDSSKKGFKYNKNHGRFKNVIWSNVIPSMNQLAYKAITDADGNYTLSFVKYAGNGQVFNITPIKNIHSFLPSQKRQFLGEGTEYVSIDFKDISSFRVTGNVVYTLDDSNYPAKGIRLLIDGKIVTNHGMVVETNASGEFDIQVPIGEHVLSVQKENHYFEHSTFPSNGRLHDFRENITGIQFKDTTTILVAGRVVGGRLEGDKLIGFGLSQNNIGQSVISFQSEQDDRYRKQITSDPKTGEYQVKLLPINTIVTGLSVSNPDVIFKAESYSDILKLGNELIIKEEKNIEYEDRAKTIVKSEKIFEYNFKKNFIYRAKPSLALVNDKDEDFCGENTMGVIVNRQTGESVEVDISDNQLGYPALLSDKLYSLKIKAFEKYTNPNLDPVLTSLVPVTDGTISVVNNLGDCEEIENNGDTETIDLNNKNGEVSYNFISSKPSLLANNVEPEFSFTETLKITLEAGGNVSEWKPDNKFFRAYLVGSKAKGNGYVTTGPETVKWILHDPPGSNSNTFISSGTTLTNSSQVSFHQSINNDTKTLLDVGPKLVVGGGLLGPQIATDTKAEFNITYGVSQSAGRNDVDVTSVTFNESVKTGSGPNQVGAIADLFVGYASNVIYGEAESFNLTPVSHINDNAYDAVGDAVRINGVDYKLAKAPSFFINTNGFNTMFVYSRYHIENIVIPELKELRNHLFAKPDRSYVSKLVPAYNKYGLNNDDPLWQASASTVDPLKTEVADYDGLSYTFDYANHTTEVDSVRWYNQQIRLWTEALSRSEKEKIESDEFFNEESSNISFAGGDQSYESSRSTSKTKEVVETWDLTLDNGFAATFGLKINDAGTINTNTFSLKMGGGGTYVTSNNTSNTYGFALADADVGDAFTVDILDPKSGSSPVFRLRAGRSACPFEGPEETKYYQAGTIFSQGTQQREKAKLTVASSQIVDNMPGHIPAVFTINMGNSSETGDPSWYALRVVEGSNPHGASVKLNGGILSTPIEISGGSNAQVQVSVGKNPLYDDYENIKLMMYSTCEFQNYQNYGSIVVADTVTLSAFFIPSCGDLEITKPQKNWVVNNESENKLEIVVEGLTTVDASFKTMILQYRPNGATNWINLQKYTTNSSLVEDGIVLIEEGTRNIKYDWDTEQVNEGRYEIRLHSTCKGNIINDTEPLIGIIDRECPNIFGSVSPEDGVLNSGEVIRFSFNEDLRQELLNKQNIKVRGVLNGGELTHSVAAYFDGVDNNMLIRTNGQTYTKSFTIEFWAKRSGDGKQIIYSQASGSPKQFEIGFDENNKFKLQIANETLLSPAAVERDKWFHWAVSYDNETNLITLFKNDQDLARTILKQAITRVDDIRLGRASVGTPYAFKGSLHELRIWNKALTRSLIASKMSARLSGNEIDLQALWRMDEGTGDICVDEVRSRNAIFNAEWEISPKGRSVALNGATSVKVKSDKFAFGGDDDFTLSFWFYSSSKRDQTLFSNGDAALATEPHEWKISLNATGHLIAKNSAVEYPIGNKLYNDGNWHHIAMVVRNPGATNFIVDGHNESSISSTDVGGLASSYFWLGAEGNINAFGETTNLSYMNGYIDEFRIWNYARSQKMIVRDMLYRMPNEELGLVAYLPFEKYEIDMNVASLEPSFEDLSKNHTVVVSNGLTLDENVPNIKLPRAIENVNFTLLKTEREVVVQLDEKLSRIERCNIDVSIFDVLDLQNNKMRSLYTQTIKIDQNQLRWETSATKKEFPEHEGGEFIIKVVNTGIQSQTFSINNLPTWLEVRPQAGTIEGGQSLEITMNVHAGLNVGYYHEQIYLRGNESYNEPLFLDVAIQASKPDWSKQLENFQYNMNVIGRLIIDDIPSTDENDMIAAYVGSELRGFANVNYQNNYDNYAVYLSIGSNVTSGEIVKFKIWDASTGLVYPVDDIQYNFESDAIKGSVSTPIEFRTGDLIQRDINLIAGWNWVSVNLRNADDEVNTVFANIAADDNDRLVGQNTFYTYDNNQWTGASNLISFTSMYKLHVSEAVLLRIAGIPIDPISTIIPLIIGWNWVSYTPQFNAEINEAMSLYTAKDNDEIKTMGRFARYDVQTRKWYGSLTHLKPGEGYQIKTSTKSNLIYPESSSFTTAASLRVKTKSTQAKPAVLIEDEKSILMVDSKQNMSMVAILQDEAGRYVTAEKIHAYINDQEVSLTKKAEGPNSDRNLYYITIPSDEDSNEIHFKYETVEGKKKEVITKIKFTKDASRGTVRNPEVLIVNAINDDSSKLNVIPNPASTSMSAVLVLEEESEVTLEIFNLTGQKIYASDEGHKPAGIHTINLNHMIGNLKSATYLMVVRLDSDVIQSKFIKM